MSYEDGRTSNAVERLGVLFVYGVANVVFSVLSGSELYTYCLYLGLNFVNSKHKYEIPNVQTQRGTRLAQAV
jgi:hypothetical protein